MPQEPADEKTKIAEAAKRGLEQEQRAQRATLQDVYDTVSKYLHITDYDRIDAILAAVISNQLKGTPIWLVIVGNSGDWKSAFLKSIEGYKNVLKVDQITPNTLASGNPKVSDLGEQLQKNSHVILFPDLASITAKDPKEKALIWGQFRNLYDGFIEKRTGSGVHKAYEGTHVTMLAASTEIIRDEILIHQQLGSRELLYDTQADKVDNFAKMDKAWDNEECEEQMNAEITQIVHSFLNKHPVQKIAIPLTIKEFLKAEADRLSTLRASEATDRIFREVLNPIYPEIPTRTIKQFKRLYIALKSLDPEYPDEKACRIVSHIVNSSGITIRRMVFEALKSGDWMKIPQVQQITRLSRVSVKSQLEQLWNIGKVEKEVREERVGGYVTSYYGQDEVRGGRMEEVPYYRANGHEERKGAIVQGTLSTVLSEYSIPGTHTQKTNIIDNNGGGPDGYEPPMSNNDIEALPEFSEFEKAAGVDRLVKKRLEAAA